LVLAARLLGFYGKADPGWEDRLVAAIALRPNGGLALAVNHPLTIAA